MRPNEKLNLSFITTIQNFPNCDIYNQKADILQIYVTHVQENEYDRKIIIDKELNEDLIKYATPKWLIAAIWVSLLFF